MASADGSIEVNVTLRREVGPMLRFTLFDVSGRGDVGSVVVDPFAVAAVVEDDKRSDRGGYVPVATIHLSDGAEYVVNDYSRKVAADIWAGKSIVAS